MKIAEKAARDLGYEVVEYSYSQETWRKAMDYQVGLLANGDVPMLIRDVDAAGETWLPAMAKYCALMQMGPVMRWIVDNIVLPLKRSQRIGRIM